MHKEARATRQNMVAQAPKRAYSHALCRICFSGSFARDPLFVPRTMACTNACQDCGGCKTKGDSQLVLRILSHALGRSVFGSSLRPKLWVIEEKAMAIELGKSLLLFVEEGVKEIGGLQGDYEYVSFSRDKLHKAFLRLIDYVQSLGISVRKSSVEDLYQVCRAAQEAGRFGEALESLEKLVLMTPRNARYNLEFGRALLQAGEYARAIEVLQKAVTLDPTTGVAHHQLAHAYDRSGRTEDALYSFERALEIDPDVSSNYRCYGECLYRKSLSLRTDAEKEQTLKKVLRLLDSCAKIGGDDEKKRVAGYILTIKEQLAGITQIDKTDRDAA